MNDCKTYDIQDGDVQCSVHNKAYFECLEAERDQLRAEVERLKAAVAAQLHDLQILDQSAVKLEAANLQIEDIKKRICQPCICRLEHKQPCQCWNDE